jgi:hypothetical protein
MSYYSLAQLATTCSLSPFLPSFRLHPRLHHRAAVRRRPPPSAARAICHPRNHTTAIRAPPPSVARAKSRRCPCHHRRSGSAPPPRRHRLHSRPITALQLHRAPPAPHCITTIRTHRRIAPPPSQRRPYVTVPAVHPVSPARHRVAASLLLPES